jgi:hypothetical protein
VATALEKRVRKLERSIPAPRCNKPSHDQLFVFWIGDEKTAEVEALLKSIDECETCTKKDRMLIRFGRFTNPEPL